MESLGCLCFRLPNMQHFLTFPRLPPEVQCDSRLLLSELPDHVCHCARMHASLVTSKCWVCKFCSNA